MKKKISKKERLKRQRITQRLISFSQLPYEDQLKNPEVIAEIG